MIFKWQTRFEIHLTEDNIGNINILQMNVYRGHKRDSEKNLLSVIIIKKAIYNLFPKRK